MTEQYFYTGIATSPAVAQQHTVLVRGPEASELHMWLTEDEYHTASIGPLPVRITGEANRHSASKSLNTIWAYGYIELEKKEDKSTPLSSGIKRKVQLATMYQPTYILKGYERGDPILEMYGDHEGEPDVIRLPLVLELENQSCSC